MLNVFFLLVVVSVIILVVLYLFQEKLIFKGGDKLTKDFKYNFSNSFKEVFIKTDIENEINAIHFKLTNPKGVVLFCHGNKGNLTKWGNRVSYLLDYNYDVLVYDYRGYGKSTGNYSEKNMYSDAISVYEYLKKNYKEKHIVVYGFSLGATFATKVASAHKPKELILEAPFYNFKCAVKYKYSLLPVFLLKYKFRTDLYIKKVTTPITVFHGNNDKTTFFKESKKLLKLNSSSKNQFIEIEGGTHHNIKEYDVYKKKLKEILNR